MDHPDLTVHVSNFMDNSIGLQGVNLVTTQAHLVLCIHNAFDLEIQWLF